MKATLFLLLICLSAGNITLAQDNYIVKTSPQNKTNISEEEQFIENHFPLQPLCKWTSGMKFMFIPDAKDQFVPILCTYDGKDIDNSKFKYKIFEFLGTEETTKEIHSGTNYNTRFLFSSEGQKFYHEVKNQRLDEICQRNPRASINGFVYLKDVDVAREQLIGKIVYTRATTARVDDSNSYTGYKEVPLPQNIKVTITNVGVGSKAYPVKIIFEDVQGNVYYMEEALSRTNSGMDIADFQADKKMRYFPNAFSFTDKNVNSLESLKSKYIDMAVYPKKTIAAKGKLETEKGSESTRVHLLRYTPLKIRDIVIESPSTAATLALMDTNGNTYEVEVDLKYDFVIKNDNFIEDLFAFGDIQKKYPHITPENWQLIAQGEVKVGMDTDECRLSLGTPIQIEFRKDSRFETWFYNGKVLEFESSRLLRFK